MMNISCEPVTNTNMPAVMLIDARGAEQFVTAEARRMCEQWNRGLKDVTSPSGQDLRLPAAVCGLLQVAVSRGCDVGKTGVRVRHPRIAELAVTIHTGGSAPGFRSRMGWLITFVGGTEAAAFQQDSRAQHTLSHLTPCERRVAMLVAEGLRNEDIARRLQRSRRTIEFQLNAVYRKLDMHGRTQLVRALL
jgi:DNA-binding CsgD family transcriptional regulator